MDARQAILSEALIHISVWIDYQKMNEVMVINISVYTDANEIDYKICSCAICIVES